MTALSTSTSSIQRDIRSESRSYKRDKDHNTKWALGTRPSPGVKYKSCWELDEFRTGSKEQQAKVRPEKRWTDHWDSQNAHRARMARKEDALKEVSSGASLSRSLSDLFPNPSPLSRSSSIDSGVLYSFDAPTTPRRAVRLNSLIEKAEIEWESRETDKIIRNEYEILDESGEVKVITKGKGKKSSPRQRPQVVTRVEDDDDWETI